MNLNLIWQQKHNLSAIKMSGDPVQEITQHPLSDEQERLQPTRELDQVKTGL